MVFRLSFAAADARVRAIAEQAGGGGSDGATASPIPARYCRWTTDLMAAGFALSGFPWLAVLPVG